MIVTNKFNFPLKTAKSIYIEIKRVRKTSNTSYEVIIYNLLHNIIYKVDAITKFKVSSYVDCFEKVATVLKRFPNEFVNVIYHDNL